MAIIIGITGSFATGKSLILSMFESKGCPIFNSDLVIRDLIKLDKKIINLIKSEFPESVDKNEIVNRNILRDIIFTSAEAKKQLEDIIYPQLFSKFNTFISQYISQNIIIAIEMPLIYEKDLQENFDIIILTASTKRLQVKRAAKRGINKKTLKQILNVQLPFNIKKSKGALIIQTGLGKHKVNKKIDNIIANAANNS